MRLRECYYLGFDESPEKPKLDDESMDSTTCSAISKPEKLFEKILVKFD